MKKSLFLLYLKYVMVSKYLFKDDLYELLQISDKKKYSLQELERYMTKECLKKATIFYNSYTGVCNCGKCLISKNNLLKIIKNYLIIDETKPSCFFLEFNQKPIEIDQLNIIL
jgi:hypothetical protein